MPPRAATKAAMPKALVARQLANRRPSSSSRVSSSLITRKPSGDVAALAPKPAAAPSATPPQDSDPLQQEQADLQEALLKSKADCATLNADGIVVATLDRQSQSAAVRTAIATHEALESCRQRVAQAGCELQPAWAGGAWVLIPLTQEAFSEANITITAHDVVMLRSDVEAVKAALRSIRRGGGGQRPQLKPVCPADRLPTPDAAQPESALADITNGAAARADEEQEVVARWCSYDVRVSLSEDGASKCTSAPARLEQDA